MSRLRANQITNENANGAPNFPHGLTVTGIVTATTSSTTMPQIVVGSAVTANSQGVDTVGIVTATTFKDKAGGTFAPNPTTTQGDIIVRGASANERLAIGAAGKSLKVNSSANGLEYGDAGAWVKIASGSGPGATTVTLDNIFSDSYDFYKLFYFWSEDDWMKMQYIKDDGSVETGSNYTWTGYYAKENSDASGRYGANASAFGCYSYWNATDDSPAVCEVTYYKPYSSSKETCDHYSCVIVEGAALYWHAGSNVYTSAGSHRGVKLIANSGSDQMTSSNFKYLVLGAKM